MTKPSCPKCGNDSFERIELKVKKSSERHSAVVCSSCGAIAGIVPAYNVPYILGKIAEALGVRFDS